MNHHHLSNALLEAADHLEAVATLRRRMSENERAVFIALCRTMTEAALRPEDPLGGFAFEKAYSENLATIIKQRAELGEAKTLVRNLNRLLRKSA